VVGNLSSRSDCHGWGQARVACTPPHCHSGRLPMQTLQHIERERHAPEEHPEPNRQRPPGHSPPRPTQATHTPKRECDAASAAEIKAAWLALKNGQNRTARPRCPSRPQDKRSQRFLAPYRWASALGLAPSWGSIALELFLGPLALWLWHCGTGHPFYLHLEGKRHLHTTVHLHSASREAGRAAGDPLESPSAITTLHVAGATWHWPTLP